MLHSLKLSPSRSLLQTGLIVGFALFTGLAAQIRFPLAFTPVPVTLQVLAVILTGLLLSPKNSFLSQLSYLALVAGGAPLAAGGVGGPALFIGPTAGYLFSFPLAAAFIALLAGADTRPLRRFIAGVAGIPIIYLAGVGWLALSLHLDAAQAWRLGGAPFLAVDLAKALLAAAVAQSGSRLLRMWSAPSF